MKFNTIVIFPLNTMTIYLHFFSVKLKPKNAAEVERFVKNELQLAVVYYQPLSVAHSKPLIIVYQSEQQKQKCLECGTMVFLDVSHSGKHKTMLLFLSCICMKIEWQTLLLYQNT